jgi:hypothetical protein
MVGVQTLPREEEAPFERADAYPFGAEDRYRVRVASSGEDRRAAWRLVYRAYQEQGYAAERGDGLWYGVHDLLSETTTFLVEEGDTPVAALTIVFDGPEGLPADELYRDELDALRDAGGRLCEIVSLVNIDRSRRARAEIVKQLFKLAYITARYGGCATNFVITVNPHHVPYYERVLLFDVRGEEKTYDKVGGAPAVLLHLDLVTAEAVYRERYCHLDGEKDLYRFFMRELRPIARWVARKRRRASLGDRETSRLLRESGGTMGIVPVAAG